jgi:hypothetical protein
MCRLTPARARQAPIESTPSWPYLSDAHQIEWPAIRDKLTKSGGQRELFLLLRKRPTGVAHGSVDAIWVWPQEVHDLARVCLEGSIWRHAAVHSQCRVAKRKATDWRRPFQRAVVWSYTHFDGSQPTLVEISRWTTVHGGHRSIGQYASKVKTQHSGCHANYWTTFDLYYSSLIRMFYH